MKTLNDQLHKILSEKVTPADYTRWLSSLRIREIDERSITLVVPTNVAKDIIEDDLFQELVDGIRAIMDRDLQIRIVAEKNIHEIPKELNPFKNNDIGIIDNSSLNTKYTFEEFVVGKSNELAYAASLSLTKTPGEQYNPLFIYGSSGLGKTHLLNAIGNQIKQNDPQKHVYYLSTERFLNEYVLAIQEKKILEFRNKYREMDVLLIDDIHFLNKKEGTQEEIFHTFNALYENGSQIVFTSDRLPNEIPFLEQRLVTRFQSGLVVDIQSPDFETRLAILRKKVETDNIQIGDDCLIYMANNIKNNVRLLIGAIITTLAHSSLLKQNIDINLVRDVVSGIVKPNHNSISFNRKIMAPDILKTVSEYYKIPESQITGKRRTASMVIPRQVSAYLMKKFTKLSLKEIAEYLGKKDHSTVIHAVKKIETMLNQKDSRIKEDLDSIISLLNID
ncbi:TPA: chromosomal replication initiator protein DnaA [candidate division WOR-3 bacterium]|jgi:chromosomal replication initiator protein|uniref:Chromosomal replication initiator protein DnaA n=1 Tax=candidate division WOR-3 bacterium TaxID=2052148 RepID=A0A350HBX0_UNCW3|nr:chromosomal replication initiator protein DnaA [candidate division WOR-3 bacterium]